ncbi:MAG: 3'-5' exonuclease, partial [Shewanella sp.]
MKSEATAAVSVQGRVLTRHAIHRHGSLVLQYYLATPQGPVLVEVQGTEHICFCHQTDVTALQLQTPGQALRFVPLALKSFKGGAVSGVYAKSSNSLRSLQRIAKDADIPLFEADIRPEQRYLIERFVALDVAFLGRYSATSDRFEANSLPVFIAERAKSLAPLIAVHLRCISLDFECSFEGLLYSVALYGQNSAKDCLKQAYEKVIMVGEAELNSPDYIEWVADEAALIHRLIAWFHEYDPDLIIGWSVVSFDLALL